MTRSGPLHTLLAGLALALVMLSLNATTGSGTSSYGGAPPSPVSAAPSASAAPSGSSSPSPSPTGKATNPASPAAPPDADYAGRTADRTASVAITLSRGRAVAYVCDGRTKEAWLRGDVAADGGMRLTGANGARLDGTVSGTGSRSHVTGTVELTGRDWRFSAARAVKPSGLYRATGRVRGARVVGGWIVLRDGAQVGVVNRDGTPSAAPSIDPETGAVTVDGTRLTAKPVVP